MKTNIAHPIVKRKAAYQESEAALRYRSGMMTEKSFHEAGHAVAASVLGTPIKLASLNDGVTTVWWTGSDQARRHEAIIAMAGAAAETRAMNYSREQCDELWKTVWAVDKENCKRQLGGAGTEHAMRQARWIIEDNWDGIEKVAAALEKHGTLTGEDVAVLLST